MPVSPDEQAAAIVDCLKAGATLIHLHIRTTSIHNEFRSDSRDESRQSEKESLNATDVARTLLALRAAAPAAPLGISTGAWIMPDAAARLRAVAGWDVMPDFASVNFNEAGAVELAKLLLARGIAVEVGLSDAKSAEAFRLSGLATRCLRVLLEPQEQDVVQALENVHSIERVLEAVTLPRVLHGTEATVWPILDEAIARGYGVRVGLEDSLLMPDGKVAADNVELISEAVRRVRAANSKC